MSTEDRFKKAEFAKIIAAHIDKKTVLSEELKKIFLLINLTDINWVLFKGH